MFNKVAVFEIDKKGNVAKKVFVNPQSINTVEGDWQKSFYQTYENSTGETLDACLNDMQHETGANFTKNNTVFFQLKPEDVTKLNGVKSQDVRVNILAFKVKAEEGVCIAEGKNGASSPTRSLENVEAEIIACSAWIGPENAVVVPSDGENGGPNPR